MSAPTPPAPTAEVAPSAHPLPSGALKFGHCESPIAYAEGEPPDHFAHELLEWRAARPDRYGYGTLPADIRLIPDTAQQKELHLVFDEDPLVRGAMRAMVSAASPHGTVVLHVRDAVDRPVAQRLLDTLARGNGRISEGVPPEGIWLRDFGGHPVSTASGPARLDFDYTVDCVVDDGFPASIEPVVRVPLWVEGGSLLTDGKVCFVADIVASENDLSPAAAAAALKPLGCDETVWLLTMPDSIPHLDPFMAVTDPRPDGRTGFVLADIDAKADPEMHGALEENARRLAPYGEVLRVPVPAGRPIAPQLNVMLFNGVVMVPDLGSMDARLWLGLQDAWPSRKLVPIPATGLAELEGGPHCVAATVPER